jgi:hypothetical protein
VCVCVCKRAHLLGKAILRGRDLLKIRPPIGGRVSEYVVVETFINGWIIGYFGPFRNIIHGLLTKYDPLIMVFDLLSS